MTSPQISRCCTHQKVCAPNYYLMPTGYLSHIRLHNAEFSTTKRVCEPKSASGFLALPWLRTEPAYLTIAMFMPPTTKAVEWDILPPSATGQSSIIMEADGRFTFTYHSDNPFLMGRYLGSSWSALLRILRCGSGHGMMGTFPMKLRTGCHISIRIIG